MDERESQSGPALASDDPAGPSLATLMAAVYDELRKVAKAWIDKEHPGHTLQATALVHEVYLRLVAQDSVRWQNRAHFLSVAARAVRRVLVDHARAKRRHKRGGGRKKVPLDTASMFTIGRCIDALAFDETLDRLAALSERQGRIVELRFFGGLSSAEVADVLGVSVRTVEGDWNMARVWLMRELERGDAA